MRLTLSISIIVLASTVARSSAAEKITFEDHIKPIFRQHCFSCHNQGEQKGGLALDDFTSVVEGGGGGEIIFDDGDVEGSRLWQLINHDDSPEMPPNQDKIPADQLSLIRRWIEDGILQNHNSKSKPKKQNALAFVANSGGRPQDGGAMPETVSLKTPVVTDRPAAISAIAASPWAPLVAIAGQKQIVLYHTETAELLGILPFDEGEAQGLRFSRDGSYLIAAGGQHSVLGIVAVYDVKSGERVAVVGDELDTVFDGDANESMTQIALGGPKKMLRLFDAADGTQLFELKKHTDWIYAVAYSPDGVLIASGDRSGGLCVWEADTGRLFLDLIDHKDAIHSVAWRDDSNVLASASADGTVKLWDMNLGKMIKSINAGALVHDVAFDHQGRLFTGTADKKAKLWDVSGNHVRDFQPMTEDVLEVEISHDGKHIIAGDWSGSVMLVNTDDPAKQQPLAANPAPLDVRLQAVQAKIVSIEAEMVPIQQRLDQAKADLETALRPIQKLEKEVVAKNAQLDQVKDQVAALTQQLHAIDTGLPALIESSRDSQDSLIAVRVTSKNAKPDDQVAQANIALAEKTLADQLLELSDQRHRRIDLANQIGKLQENQKNLRQQIRDKNAGLPAMKQIHESTEQVFRVAKTAHQLAQRRLDGVRRKAKKMAAELE
jgi:WD40 repeat protein